MENNLILPFAGSNDIENYYSQAGQDTFVLSVLDGKRGGIFLDIGCNHPKIISNTYLLESKFGWNGILIDLDNGMVELCKKERTSVCVCADATLMDYSDLLIADSIIDYLSVDIDGIATFLALQKVNHKAKVITFEHNLYIEGNEVRELSRKYLDSLGYLRLCSDVINDGGVYEDWYIYPELVNVERAMALQSDNKDWRNILFKN